MRRWNDLINEEPSQNHQKTVMLAARAELRLNRERSPLARIRGQRRAWLWQSAGVAFAGLSSIVLGVRIARQSIPEPSTAPSDIALEEKDFGELMETADNVSFLEEIELLEDLEAMERWENV